ncbi:MAG: amidohydrolase family protein [Muribaculaceae bacterium]|nr:amidohydrolase family protein [Muribaculaceae bacterium]
MKIIAVEEHLSSKTIGAAVAKTIREAYPYAQQFMHPAPADAPSVTDLFELGEKRIAELDKAGIDMEVVSYTNPTQWLTGEEAVTLAKQANDTLSEAVRPYPDRFRAFATLPWDNPTAAADELRRTVNELGFVGTLISGRPQPGSVFLDDKIYYPVWEALTELDLPVYIHPNYTSVDAVNSYYKGLNEQFDTILSSYGYGWHYEAGIQIIRMILAGVFEKYPTLKVISGHWGEMVPYFLYRLDQMFKPEVTGLSDTISSIYKTHVWISPSGLYDNDALQFCVNKLGIDQLVFSADWPYVPMTDARAFVANAPLSDSDREKFSYLNAEKLLHITG